MRLSTLLRALPVALLVGFIFPLVAQAQWSVTTYSAGGTLISNLADADRVISGEDRAYSSSATYVTSKTSDNGGIVALPPGPTVQVFGLPAGDNDDFVFQARAAFLVGNTGPYMFFNNTDDGSRLRLSRKPSGQNKFVPLGTIILDDVLSGPHDASIGPVAQPVNLTMGDTIELEWMWFERNGGAEGETWYTRTNASNPAAALWQDSSQGLTLQGGSYTGTVYKARTAGNPGTNSNGPNTLAEADAYLTFGEYRGSSSYQVINLGSGGRAGGDSALPPGTPGDHFVVLATGLIHVTAGQVGVPWTFFTNSDDGSRLRINGVNVVLDDFVQGPQDSAYAVFTFPVAGDYPVEYTGFEGGGGESFEVWYYPGQPNSLVKGLGQPDYDHLYLLGDPAGPLAVIQTPPAPGLSFPGLLLELTTVGDPGNPADTVDGDNGASGVQNYGAVAYPFLIGTTEVTRRDYAAFLNDVDPDGALDPYNLWNADMIDGDVFAVVPDPGIVRFPTLGGPSYVVDESVALRPVTHVTFLSAMRFANWLHNGGIGSFARLGNDAVNTGAYTLTGVIATDGVALRNATAKYWIPNADEWYKAAYYDPTRVPGGVGRNDNHLGPYWIYPFLADRIVWGFPHPAPGTPLNLANCKDINRTIDVKSYLGGASHYGTYDQGCNAWEWIENRIGSPTRRGVRGGGWGLITVATSAVNNALKSEGPIRYLNPASYVPDSADYEPYPIGFRVAATANAGTSGALPQCVKPPPNMVLWLPFDEASGSRTKNAVTASPAYDGTLIGAPPHITGRVGNALQFGAGRYVSVPDYPALNFGAAGAAGSGQGDFSVDAWIMRDANVGFGVEVIMDKRAPSGFQAGYHMYLYDNGLGFQISTATATSNFNLPNSIPLGVWTHFAVTVRRNDPAGLNFYINGQLQETGGFPFSTVAFNASMNNSSPFVVGARSSTSGLLNGKVDEMEVFTRALTDGEVLSIYNAGSAGKCLSSCSVSPYLKFNNTAQTSITATVQICNASGVDQTYTYSFGGLPPSPGCWGRGPKIFTPASGTIMVPAGKCESIQVVIGRPSGFGGFFDSFSPYSRACYEMVLSDATGTVELSRCRGILADSDASLELDDVGSLGGNVIKKTDDIMQGDGLLPGSNGVMFPVEVTNGSSSAYSGLKYEFIVLRDDMVPDVESVSLNGEAPGTAAAGTLSLAPGASVAIPMTAAFVKNDPLHTYTLLLQADLGGNGVMQPFGSYRLENVVLPSIQLQSAVSRKVHGAAGAFDIPLPLTGSPGIECRRSDPAGTHTLVLTFNNEILTGSVSVTAGTGSVSGAPTFNAVTNEMTVNLTGVSDLQPTTVTLSGMKDIAGQALANTTVTMGFLLGDVNGSGAVNSTDIVLVKAQSATTVDASNFRRDVNASGTINSTDIVITKSRSGSALP